MSHNYSLPDYSKVKDQLREVTLGTEPATAYESGFIGAYYNPEDDEELQSLVEADGGKFAMADIAYGSGFAGQGKGRPAGNNIRARPGVGVRTGFHWGVLQPRGRRGTAILG